MRKIKVISKPGARPLELKIRPWVKEAVKVVTQEADQPGNFPTYPTAPGENYLPPVRRPNEMLRDRTVFDIETFVPSEVVHRDGALDALSAAIEPVLNGGRGRHTHIFGPSGAGKTCVARYALKQVHEERPAANRQYINCWDHYNTSAVLYELAAGVGAVADVRRGTVAHDELIGRVREADDCAYIVVLDEVDQIEAPQVLYQLHRLGHVYCIYICNDEDAFFSQLDGRVASRLRAGTTVSLEPYSDDVLVEILAARAEAGLEPHAAPRGRLVQIADIAAGDARVGVELLFQSAREATACGHEFIREADVEEAEPVARAELRQKTLSQLTRHQRRLFEVLQDTNGPLGMGDLEERYAGRVESPKSRKTLQRYLEKLEQYNLVEIEGEKRGRTYAAL